MASDIFISSLFSIKLSGKMTVSVLHNSIPFQLLLPRFYLYCNSLVFITSYAFIRLLSLVYLASIMNIGRQSHHTKTMIIEQYNNSVYHTYFPLLCISLLCKRYIEILNCKEFIYQTCFKCFNLSLRITTCFCVCFQRGSACLNMSR